MCNVWKFETYKHLRQKRQCHNPGNLYSTSGKSFKNNKQQCNGTYADARQNI